MMRPFRALRLMVLSLLTVQVGAGLGCGRLELETFRAAGAGTAGDSDEGGDANVAGRLQGRSGSGAAAVGSTDSGGSSGSSGSSGSGGSSGQTFVQGSAGDEASAGTAGSVASFGPGGADGAGAAGMSGAAGNDDGPSCAAPDGVWNGCSTAPCAVCAAEIAGYPLYLHQHPRCTSYYACDHGTQYPCSRDCPPPGDADQCDGTPGNWSGCRGLGCYVCTELVQAYPRYFKNHPFCIPNGTCGGEYFTCSAACPAPNAADR